MENNLVPVRCMALLDGAWCGWTAPCVARRNPAMRTQVTKYSFATTALKSMHRKAKRSNALFSDEEESMNSEGSSAQQTTGDEFAAVDSSAAASRFFKIGDFVTDCGRGGRVGEVVSIYQNIVTVDWGLETSNCHYTDLDHTH